MVSDYINRSCGAFKIIAPGLKSLMDSEELLVMGVIVEFQSGQSLGIVRDRPNLLVRIMNGENASDGIVRGICLYNDWSVWNPMGEDRSGVKASLRFWKVEQQESLKFQEIPLCVRQVKGVMMLE